MLEAHNSTILCILIDSYKNPKKLEIVLKNDHLSENLAIGALIYHQKKSIFFFKSWKNLSSGENVEIGTTWDPWTYVYQS